MKKIIVICLLMLMLIPIAQAGVIEDTIDWVYELFGYNYDSALNYVDFKGYVSYTDKEQYFCFPDSNGIIKDCEYEYLTLINQNKFTDFITIRHDINLKQAQILKHYGVNNSVWEDITDERIKIQAEEMLHLRFKYLPPEESGKVTINFISEKVGEFDIDPLYNISDGWYFGGIIKSPNIANGLGYNGSNFFIGENDRSTIHITDLSGNNMSGMSFVISACNLQSIATNKTTLIASCFPSTIKVYDLMGNSLSSHDVSGAGIGDIRGVTMNGSDFWALDVTDIAVYHLGSNFGNLTGGFGTTEVGSTAPRDIAFVNSSQFMISDMVDNCVYCVDYLGNNITNCSIDTFAYGSDVPIGIATNMTFPDDLSRPFTDLHIIDYEDFFKYHFRQNLTEVVANAPVIENNYTVPLSPAYNDNVYWIVNISDADGDIIPYCNLTVEDPEGTLVSNNQNMSYNYTYTMGSTSGYVWNSTTEAINKAGTWDWNYTCADSTGNKVTEYGSFEVNVLTINAETYDLTVTEGEQTTFTINISLGTGSLTSAMLWYNGTNYTGGITAENLTTDIITKTLTIGDIVNAISNVSFNWSFVTSVGNFNNTKKNQTVLNMGVGNCDDNKILAFNFTLWDEGNQTQLNGTIETDFILMSYFNDSINWTYHHTYNFTHNVSICVPQDVLNKSNFKVDATTSYKSTGYATEYHYYDDYNLTNQTLPLSILLYDLLTSDSSSFLFTYYDNYYIGVENAIIEVWRYYVGDGLFRNVEMAKTNEAGQTRVHLVTEDYEYYFIVRRNGTLLWTTEEYFAICLESPCQINIYGKEGIGDFENFEKVDNLAYELSLNETSRLATLTFATDNGADAIMNMEIIEFDDDMNTSVYNQTTTSSSGTLSYTIPESITNKTYMVSIRKDGKQIKWQFFDLRISPSTYFGAGGIIMASLVALSLGLMAISSGGSGVIILFLVGLFFSGLMYFFKMGWFTFVYVVVAGLIIIIKIMRRGSTP